MEDQINYVGAEVYWNDPDNGECSGWRIIQEIISEDVVLLTNEKRNEYTEAYITELS